MEFLLNAHEHVLVAFTGRQSVLNRRFRRDNQADFTIQQEFEFINGFKVVRVGHGDGEQPVFVGNGDERQAMHPFHGDQRKKFRIDAILIQRVIGETILVGHGPGQVIFRDQSVLQQDVRERTMAGLRLANRLRKLPGREHVSRYENLFQGESFDGGGHDDVGG